MAADQNPILIAIELLDGLGGPAQRRQEAEGGQVAALREIRRGGRGAGVRVVAEHLSLDDRQVVEAAEARASQFGQLENTREQAICSLGFCDGFFAAFMLLELRGWDTEALQKPKVESEDGDGGS